MLKAILISVGISATVYLAIALGLVALSRPSQVTVSHKGLDFSRVLANPARRDDPPGHIATMRDGTALPIRRYGTAGQGPLVVMLHGSGWHGLQFDQLARALGNQADIVVPDLRGHGFAPQRRGDLDYIGQFEDDLQDLISQLRGPGQMVVLLGHSSGGGLAVRASGGPLGAKVDGIVLLAPFLKYNAPTTRPNSGGWARPLTQRIIGLTMLNWVGISWLNHLTVIQFAMPQAVIDGPLGHTATLAYSHRLNTSFAPRSDYLSDIAALPPFLLVAGDQDEAFIAHEYEPLMSAHSDKGSYHVIPSVNHLDVVNAAETLALLRDFLTLLRGPR